MTYNIPPSYFHASSNASLPLRYTHISYAAFYRPPSHVGVAGRTRRLLSPLQMVLANTSCLTCRPIMVVYGWFVAVTNVHDFPPFTVSSDHIWFLYVSPIILYFMAPCSRLSWLRSAFEQVYRTIVSYGPWAAGLLCWCCRSKPSLESTTPARPRHRTPCAPPRCCSLPSSSTAAETPPSPRLLCPGDNNNNHSNATDSLYRHSSPGQMDSSAACARCLASTQPQACYIHTAVPHSRCTLQWVVTRFPRKYCPFHEARCAVLCTSNNALFLGPTQVCRPIGNSIGPTIDVKNVFYVFYSCHVFYVF